jgi:inward rectifier potassium channel
MFALSWQIMHRIDENSPLYGITAQGAKDTDTRLAVTIAGVDEIFAAGVNARHFYTQQDILFGQRFIDIFIDGDHPQHHYLDLGLFHDVRADDDR